jgi:DNA polymerase-1
MQPAKKFCYLAKTVVSAILDWRSLIKLQNTYVEALPLQVDAVTKRIHTDYMQTVRNGPIEFDKSEFANIPIRTERGQKIRKAFIADENYTNLCRLLSN